MAASFSNRINEAAPGLPTEKTLKPVGYVWKKSAALLPAGFSSSEVP